MNPDSACTIPTLLAQRMRPVHRTEIPLKCSPGLPWSPASPGPLARASPGGCRAIPSGGAETSSKAGTLSLTLVSGTPHTGPGEQSPDASLTLKERNRALVPWHTYPLNTHPVALDKQAEGRVDVSRAPACSSQEASV